jgi:hypothetical protein
MTGILSNAQDWSLDAASGRTSSSVAGILGNAWDWCLHTPIDEVTSCSVAGILGNAWDWCLLAAQDGIATCTMAGINGVARIQRLLTIVVRAGGSVARVRIGAWTWKNIKREASPTEPVNARAGCGLHGENIVVALAALESWCVLVAEGLQEPGSATRKVAASGCAIVPGVHIHKSRRVDERGNLETGNTVQRAQRDGIRRSSVRDVEHVFDAVRRARGQRINAATERRERCELARRHGSEGRTCAVPEAFGVGDESARSRDTLRVGDDRESTEQEYGAQHDLPKSP